MIGRLWRWWRRVQRENRRRPELFAEAVELYGYPEMYSNASFWHSLSIGEQEAILRVRRLYLQADKQRVEELQWSLAWGLEGRWPKNILEDFTP